MSSSRTNLASQIVPINTGETFNIYRNLVHAYGAEYPEKTTGETDASGRYIPIHYPFGSVKGYILYAEGEKKKNLTPIGFCLADIQYPENHMVDIFILQTDRKKKWGSYLASWMFEHHFGRWVVKDFELTGFWEKVINNRYNKGVDQDQLKLDPKQPAEIILDNSCRFIAYRVNNGASIMFTNTPRSPEPQNNPTTHVQHGKAPK